MKNPFASFAACAALLTALAGLTSAASAQTNLIVNGGFESLTNPPAPTVSASNGDYYALESGATWLDGWDAVLVSGTSRLGVAPGTYREVSAASGSNYLVLETQAIQLTQTVHLVAGTDYVLSFDAARIGATSYISFDLSLTDGSDAAIDGNYSLTEGVGVWTNFTYEFTAANTADYTLSFLRTGNRFGIDNVSLATSAVPEPAVVAALAGLAALGFAALRRRGLRQVKA